MKHYTFTKMFCIFLYAIFALPFVVFGAIAAAAYAATVAGFRMMVDWINNW